jgi:hypothetical protein
MGPPTHERLPWPRLAEDSVTPLGLDLAKHRDEILRVVATIPQRVGQRAEFESEVWLALDDRNHMDSAFDPRRGGSIPGYVAKVAYATRGRLLRQAQKDRTRARNEIPYEEDDL